LSIVLIELQYLPPISYFSTIAGAQHVILEKCEHYQKQSYRNRCYVNTAQGKTMLIVPLTSKHGKVLIKDVRIDHTQKWADTHWRTIQSAYGKAPFFEHYADDLRQLLYSRYEFLFDMNLDLLTMCLKWLKWDLKIQQSKTYDVTLSDTISDLRSVITPKTGGYATFYKPAVYYQVFGTKFIENLSLIDLIFCEGPGAASLVQASVNKMNI
jgi:hypothetical protein